MQPVLDTTEYRDLYQFLAALTNSAEMLPSSAKAARKVLIWSPEGNSSLFDSFDKLELVNHYAKKLGITPTLSAASDLRLKEWGHKLGWQVLWSNPALDQAVKYYGVQLEEDEALAS